MYASPFLTRSNIHIFLSAVPADFELFVVFVLYEPWSGVIENLRKSKLFTLRPNYSAIVEAQGELFDISWWSCTLRGATTRSNNDLSESKCVLAHDVEVHILPRLYELEFHISSWATDYSRGELQKINEESEVEGSITRDNINSISVTVSHPEREHAYVV